MIKTHDNNVYNKLVIHYQLSIHFLINKWCTNYNIIILWNYIICNIILYKKNRDIFNFPHSHYDIIVFNQIIIYFVSLKKNWNK